MLVDVDPAWVRVDGVQLCGGPLVMLIWGPRAELDQGARLQVKLVYGGATGI